MENDQMTSNYINELANALFSNHAALMVGSGFSKNAEKIANTGKDFLDWNELADKLYESIYSKDQSFEKVHRNPLRVAQEVEVELGRPKLEEILKDAVPDSEYAPSDLYIKLMEMPWRDVFTTNYDTLLERASEKVTTRRYNVVTCQEDIVNSNDAPRIIKLHGSFPSQRPFIITENDYRTYPNKFSAMVNTVQQAMLENVFCMIGFSCEDPNFIRWTGWIHDNLGKNNSQKIYMISVSHESEARKHLLFDQNILVIDLEELWPDKSDTERIEAFIEDLSERKEEKEKKGKWIDTNLLNLKPNTNYKEKTQNLKILNETYPGWIFMPWKMKNSVSFILQNLGCLNKIDEITYVEKINYMYEYVKFSDIAGRPLLSQFVEKFWNILSNYENGDENEIRRSELKRKEQIIYVHLLRAFRELADWEKYDICRKKIDKTLLDHDSEQLLYVSDWWQALCRFKSCNLKEKLDKWKLAAEDLYWTLIKASLYAIIGEIASADELLSEDLVLVRRRLFKSDQKEYLSSIEDCIVSLINFIRTVPGDKKTEECVYDGSVSWGNENEQYYLNLKSEENEGKDFEIQGNYNLSNTYTMHLGRNYTNVFHAMEYLRFLEQTGHPFRILNIKNTEGLQSTVKILAPYYPDWCLMQIIIARSKELLDSLFGRAKLSNLTSEDVDTITRDYIEAIRVVKDRVKPENSYYGKSVYDQAAAILPDVLARLCYKCSTEVLDEILDIALEISLSSVRRIFKNMKNVFEGLMTAYTINEQGERIDKLLKFPMNFDKQNHYCDPIIYCSKPKVKYELNEDIYDTEISRIKLLLHSKKHDEKEGAEERFIQLAQLVSMKEEDKVYLYDLLDTKASLRDNAILYALDPNKYASKVDEIFNETIQKMQKECNTKAFEFRGNEYEDLIGVLNKLDIQNIDLTYRWGGRFVMNMKLGELRFLLSGA